MERYTPLSLTQLKAGEKAAFINLVGGRGIAGRLTSLGFTPGVEITMTQNSGTGPLIVMLRGARVALGRREAQKIMVQREQS
ncbi:MAG: FeoA domain-containing protein [Anaerolineales bacterium]|nr:FeoA domain-containing protein [Anaerolineales bacterium]